MNATTTCSYFNAERDDGTPATLNSQNFQFSSSTCVTVYGTSSSTNQSIANGFTYGEIVTNVQLFLLISVIMVGTYHILFRTIKIKSRKRA